MNRSKRRSLFGFAGFLCSLVLFSGCGDQKGESQNETTLTEDKFVPLPEGKVNFAEHIATIVHENCTECHRPGQSAPFSLVTYDDVRKRSKQIVEVVDSGYMPPWLPDQPKGTFINERILSANDKGLIKQWHEEGAKEGNASRTPKAPEFSGEWKLGKPDLILKLQEEFTLPAEGEDIYRNFVIPLEATEDLKFVRSVDFRPSNPELVHHMVLLVDQTNSSRLLDEESEEPGFPGIMSLTQASMPFGHFHGWTPGKEPTFGTEGIAWPLVTPSDFVLQVHMKTTGKVEKLDVEVAFYLTDETPKYQPYPIVIRNKVIELPAGESDVHVKGTFRLPVDVNVLSVYPHAHYLGTDLKAYAHMADNTTRTLLSIPSWDFDWQDEYSFPGDKLVFLPAGTVLEFDYTFDNSKDNPNNPANPPTDVIYGQNSTDEMAELLLMVLTKTPEDYEMLAGMTGYNALLAEVQALNWKLSSEPDNIELRNRLGEHLLEMGDMESALREFETVMSKPQNVWTNKVEELAFAAVTAAQINLESNELEKADELFNKASGLYQSLTNNLAQSQVAFMRGRISYENKDLAGAQTHFEKAINLDENLHEAWNSLGWILAEREENGESNKEQAISAIKKAIEITDEDYGPYIISLARMYEKYKDWEMAEKAYFKALELAQNLEIPEEISRIQELISNIKLMKSQKPVENSGG